MEIITNDVRMLDNLTALRKIMVIATKLNDPNFFKRRELKVNLIKIFKLSIYLINVLNESLKIRKARKEYFDFFREIIVKSFNIE
jgi:hypothetical protein